MKKSCLFFLFVLVISCKRIQNSITLDNPIVNTNKISTLDINWSGGINLGGYGDIASNLYSAKKIAQMRPNLRIKFLYGKSIDPKIKVLMPELATTPSLKAYGLEFMPEGDSLPPADLTLGLSRSPFANPYCSKSKLSLSFFEFTGKEHKLSNVMGNNQCGFWLSSGPKNLGIYVTPNSNPPPITRLELGNALSKIFSNPNIPQILAQNKTKLGMAYTTNTSLGLQYLHYIKKLAAKNPSFHYFALIKKDQSILNQTLPSNLTALFFEGLPFSISEAIISHSDIFLMVTGNVSFSLAVDYEKPFVYEPFMNSEPITKDFVEILTSMLPVNDRTFSPAIHEMFTLSGKKQLGENVFTLMQDDGFYSRYKIALGKVKPTISLFNKLLLITDNIQLSELSALSKDESNLFFEILRNSLDKNTFINQVKVTFPVKASKLIK